MGRNTAEYILVLILVLGVVVLLGEAVTSAVAGSLDRSGELLRDAAAR